MGFYNVGCTAAVFLVVYAGVGGSLIYEAFCSFLFLADIYIPAFVCVWSQFKIRIVLSVEVGRQCSRHRVSNRVTGATRKRKSPHGADSYISVIRSEAVMTEVRERLMKYCSYIYISLTFISARM